MNNKFRCYACGEIGLTKKSCPSSYCRCSMFNVLVIIINYSYIQIYTIYPDNNPSTTINYITNYSKYYKYTEQAYVDDLTLFLHMTKILQH